MANLTYTDILMYASRYQNIHNYSTEERPERWRCLSSWGAPKRTHARARLTPNPPCHCHLAQPVNTAGLGSCLTNSGADSSRGVIWGLQQPDPLLNNATCQSWTHTHTSIVECHKTKQGHISHNVMLREETHTVLYTTVHVNTQMVHFNNLKDEWRPMSSPDHFSVH